ncbi:P-loop containing nucleoside triphosphate hydrolase protein, partial [Phaeosphaeriaceae sp. PMI808]
FGKTGTGKTTFVKNVTNSNFEIGHGLSSMTKEVQAASAEIDGHQITLVDTPGFDDTHLTDTQVLGLIADWLKYTYDEGTLLSGIVFLHSISSDRMEGSSLKNLDMFRKLCGDENLGNVILANTKWSHIQPNIGYQREQELIQNFWASMIARGSRTTRLGDDQDSAKDVVRTTIPNRAVVLKLQYELSMGMHLSETAAGSTIARELVRIQDDYIARLDAAKREMEVA